MISKCILCSSLAHYRILETTWLFWFASSRFKPRLLARPSSGRNDKNTHPAFPLSVPWTLLYTFHIGKPACFNTLIPLLVLPPSCSLPACSSRRPRSLSSAC